MPWTVDSPPRSMRRLAPAVLAKAVAIANALLAEGYDDGTAIRIAIAQAKRWAGAGTHEPRAWRASHDPTGERATTAQPGSDPVQ